MSTILWMRWLLVLMIFSPGFSWSQALKAGIPVDEDFNRFQNLKPVLKADMLSFLEKKYNILKTNNLYGLQALEDYEKKDFGIWVDVEQMRSYFKFETNSFYQNVDFKIKDKLLTFYVKNRGSKKTLIFFPMPHMTFIHNLHIFNEEMKRNPDLNLVWIDANELALTEKNHQRRFVTSEIAEEISQLLRHTGLISTKKYFSVICYGFLYTIDLFKNRKDLYDYVIFYAPMVRNIVRDRIIDPLILYPQDKMMPMEAVYVPFHILYSFKLPLEGLTPQTQQMINVSNFHSFFSRYNDKINLKNVNNAYVILADNDLVVPHVNSQPQMFKKQLILKNADHVSIFFHKTAEYLDILNDIVNKN